MPASPNKVTKAREDDKIRIIFRNMKDVIHHIYRTLKMGKPAIIHQSLNWQVICNIVA